MMRRALFLLPLALAACPLPEYTYPPGSPNIEAFTATPFEVPPGGETTLEWRVSGASSVTLAGAPVPSEGSKRVVLSNSMTIELVAESEGGTSRARIDLQVRDPQPVQIVSFGAAPRQVGPGEVVTISWETVNATHVSLVLATGETLIEDADKSGAFVFRTPLSYTVELHAEGFEGPKTEAITVDINTPGPIIDLFFLDPPTVTPPRATTLVWQVRRAETVEVTEHFDSGVEDLVYSGPPVGGPIVFSSDGGSRTMRIVATSPSGTVSETARLIVLAPRDPEILELSITPDVNGPGGDSLVRWRTRYSDNVYIDVGPQQFSVEADGAFWSSFTESAMLTLTAGSFESLASVSRSVSLTIDPARPVVNLFAEPRYAGLGEPAHVEWSTENADRIRFITDAGDPVLTSTDAVGSFHYAAVSPVYLLAIAENAAGATQRVVPIDFEPAPEILFFTGPAVARVDRPARFSWATQNARSGSLSGPNIAYNFIDEIALGDRFVSFTSLGDAVVRLTAQGVHLTATATRSITVLQANTALSEDEPDDEPSTANGTYYFGNTGETTLAGNVFPNDVDMYAFFTDTTLRMSIEVVGLNAGNQFCELPAALDLFEEDPSRGLFDSLGTIEAGGNGSCPLFDPHQLPGFSGLRGNLVARLRTLSTNFTQAPYLLNLQVDAVSCGDGVQDRYEDCDDGNSMIGDGCSACRIEGLDEREPNDDPVLATQLQLGQAFTAYLGDDDYDFYFFTLPRDREGPVHISMMPFAELTCPKVVLAMTRDPLQPVIASPAAGCAELSGPEMVLGAGDYGIVVYPAEGLSRDLRGTYTLLVDAP